MPMPDGTQDVQEDRSLDGEVQDRQCVLLVLGRDRAQEFHAVQVQGPVRDVREPVPATGPLAGSVEPACGGRGEVGLPGLRVCSSAAELEGYGATGPGGRGREPDRDDYGDRLPDTGEGTDLGRHWICPRPRKCVCVHACVCHAGACLPDGPENGPASTASCRHPNADCRSRLPSCGSLSTRGPPLSVTGMTHRPGPQRSALRAPRTPEL